MFHGDFELLNICFKINYNSLKHLKHFKKRLKGEDFSKIPPPPSKKKKR